MGLNDKEAAAAKKVYLAWDPPELGRAIQVMEATKGLLYNVKINSAFTKQGPMVIQQLRDDYGIEGVFLDMKFYDIPGTEDNHAYAGASHDVDFMTIHAHGGVPMMMKAIAGVDKAVDEFGVRRPTLLGISVLTSFKLDDYLRTFDGVLGSAEGLLKDYSTVIKSIQDDIRKDPDLVNDDSLRNKILTIKSISVAMIRDHLLNNPELIKNQVLNLAALAEEAGIDGLVCSPMEVEYVKESYPNLVTMVPGIKGPVSGKAGDTQNMDRVATPSNAVKWGADYLVIGSAIHTQKDPAQAMRNIIEDIVKVM